MKTTFLSAPRATATLETSATTNRNRRSRKRNASIALLERLEVKVLELNCHWRSSMELQRKNTGLKSFRLTVVRDVNGCETVNLVNEMVALRCDDILVPTLAIDL